MKGKNLPIVLFAKKSFSTMAVLNNHISSKHERKRFKCEECNAVLKNKHNLKLHIATVHEGKRPFKCSNCDATYKSRYGLNQHILSIHEKKKPIKCEICESGFTSKVQLRIHVEGVHERKKAFKCDVCDKTFSIKKNMNRHIITVHKGQLSKNDLALYKYTSKNEAIVYENLTHKKRTSNLFKCSVDNEYNSSNQSSNNWKCYSCNQNFMSEKELCEHMVNVHEIDKPFKGQTPHMCVVCNSAFNCELALNNHVESLHEGISYFNLSS